MNERDHVRFRHMLDAARLLQKSVIGKTRASLDENELFGLGLEKAIEIIGEAAARVAPETRAQYPQLPWKVMIGMRNVLIHDYFDVDLNRVWDTVTNDIPPLIAQLEAIIPPEPPAS